MQSFLGVLDSLLKKSYHPPFTSKEPGANFRRSFDKSLCYMGLH